MKKIFLFLLISTSLFAQELTPIIRRAEMTDTLNARQEVFNNAIEDSLTGYYQDVRGNKKSDSYEFDNNFIDFFNGGGNIFLADETTAGTFHNGIFRIQTGFAIDSEYVHSKFYDAFVFKYNSGENFPKHVSAVTRNDIFQFTSESYATDAEELVATMGFWIDRTELNGNGLIFMDQTGASWTLTYANLNTAGTTVGSPVRLGVVEVNGNYAYVRVYINNTKQASGLLQFRLGIYNGSANAVTQLTLFNPTLIYCSSIDPYFRYKSEAEKNNSEYIGQKLLYVGDSQYNDGITAIELAKKFGFTIRDAHYGSHSMKLKVASLAQTNSYWFYHTNLRNAVLAVDADFYVFTTSSNDNDGGGSLDSLSVANVLNNYPVYGDDASTISSKMALFNALSDDEKTSIFNYQACYSAYIRQIQLTYPEAKIILCSVPISLGSGYLTGATDENGYGIWAEGKSPDLARSVLDTVRKAIKDDIINLSEKHNTLFADLFKCGLTFENFNIYCSDGVHWFPEIKRRIADIIAGTIITGQSITSAVDTTLYNSKTLTTAQLAGKLSSTFYNDLSANQEIRSSEESIITTDADGGLSLTTISEMPVSNDVSSALAQKASVAIHDTLALYLLSEIQRLEQLINIIDPPDTTTTPVTPLALAISHTAADTVTGKGTITLTWTEQVDGLYNYIYVSKEGVESFSLLDSTQAETYTHVALDPHDTVYTYYVRSSNGAGTLSNLDSAYALRVSDFVTENYYVSNASLGDSTANSWTNKKSLALFDESVVLPGDSILIQASADTLDYGRVALLNMVGTPTDLIYVVEGEGEAVFYGADPVGTSVYGAFRLGNCSYVKVVGITVKNTAELATAYTVFRVSDGEHNYIDSCHIITNGNGYALYIKDESFTTVTNSNIESIANSLNEDWAEDPIQIDGGLGGHTISYNTLTQRGSSTGATADVIQMIKVGVNEPVNGNLMTINNNFLLTDNDLGNIFQGIYMNDMYSNRIKFYNNIVSVKGTSSTKTFHLRSYNATNILSAELYNNTMIGESASHVGLQAQYVDSLTIKNNVFGSYNVCNKTYVLGATSSDEITYKDINYNVYYANDGMEYNTVSAVSGGTIYWTAWAALGYDVNSDTTGLALVSAFSNTATDYALDAGSSGIDEGTDLSSIFTVDYSGTTRTGTWDVGAFKQD